MKIRVRIERVVVDGLPLERRQGAELRAAIESELARLMSAGELRPELAGCTVAHVRGGGLRIGRGAAPADMGAGIAGVLYEGLFDGKAGGQ